MKAHPMNSITPAPEWMPRIRDFDSIEIDPFKRISFGDGETALEPCSPHSRPDLWGVFLHRAAGGRISIADFHTQREALAYAASLEAEYPHLTGYWHIAVDGQRASAVLAWNKIICRVYAGDPIAKHIVALHNLMLSMPDEVRARAVFKHAMTLREDIRLDLENNQHAKDMRAVLSAQLAILNEVLAAT